MLLSLCQSILVDSGDDGGDDGRAPAQPQEPTTNKTSEYDNTDVADVGLDLDVDEERAAADSLRRAHHQEEIRADAMRQQEEVCPDRISLGSTRLTRLIVTINRFS